jgi:osmotically-inducible protein OsmY
MTPKNTTTLRRIGIALAVAASLSACSVMRDQETVGAYVDDTKITTDIKAKMASDKDVAATSISAAAVEVGRTRAPRRRIWAPTRLTI